MAKERRRGRHFYVCHAIHENDRTYAENICEYFGQQGLECKVMEFEAPGYRPELGQCLNDKTIGILGFNSQLDHCGLDRENFVVAAAKKDVSVIHWILDHPSARWPEFTHATAANSRFLFCSEISERYFRRYCLPDARSAWIAGVGPNWRSRVEDLSRQAFLQRDIPCVIPLNLKRIGRTIADAQDRLRSLDSGLADAVEQAIERARFDLAGPLEEHLVAALARRGRDLADREFNLCFQIVEDIVQIRRRLKIFEVASRFPVLIQTDVPPESPVPGAVADFSVDLRRNGMQATINRMKSCRAVLNANYASDMLHDRTQNGLNAGCVVIIEDTPGHRQLFAHGENALLFRYDDDSLAQCLDVVCNRPERAYAIAQAGFPLRDDPAVRFGGFENILALASQ